LDRGDWFALGTVGGIANAAIATRLTGVGASGTQAAIGTADRAGAEVLASILMRGNEGAQNYYDDDRDDDAEKESQN